MECNVFFEQVKRHFRYLTDEYYFSVVAEEEGQDFDNCIVTFQSNICRIRVVRDRGDALLEISPLSTPNWFELDTVIVFLTRQPVAERWAENSHEESLKGDTKTDWQLAEMANELRPLCSQVFELFRDDIFRQKQVELTKFRERLMEEVLDLLSSGEAGVYS